LTALGLKVWYDEWTLTIGDSLRQKIDEGLAGSEFGIVVLFWSPVRAFRSTPPRNPGRTVVYDAFHVSPFQGLMLLRGP
jgi:hypothetical protein